ncbi:hypothetical protein GCM10020256_70700 [Streptomyces thermocoprophilus]
MDGLSGAAHRDGRRGARVGAVQAVGDPRALTYPGEQVGGADVALPADGGRALRTACGQAVCPCGGGVRRGVMRSRPAAARVSEWTRTAGTLSWGR